MLKNKGSKDIGLLLILIVFILVWSSLAFGQAPWSGIINPTRAENWAGGQVGTTIVNRTTICATPSLSAGSGSAAINTTAINNAIASCASGDVVSIPAGTWYVNGVLDSGKSNITIRGAGPTQTDLIFLTGTACGGNGGDFCVITGTPYYPGGSQVQPGRIKRSHLVRWLCSGSNVNHSLQCWKFWFVSWSGHRSRSGQRWCNEWVRRRHWRRF